MKDNNQTVTIVILVLVLLIFLSGFGMMGFGRGMYGIRRLCGMSGGIWCYWPSWTSIFSLLFWTLLAVALALFIIWLFKQLKNTKRKNGKRK